MSGNDPASWRTGSLGEGISAEYNLRNGVGQLLGQKKPWNPVLPEDCNKAINGQINTLKSHRFTLGPQDATIHGCLAKVFFFFFLNNCPPKGIDSLCNHLEYGYLFFAIWLKILILYSFKHPTFPPKIVEENNLPRGFLLFFSPSLKHFEGKLKGHESKM